jgi:hypothetical protein
VPHSLAELSETSSAIALLRSDKSAEGPKSFTT